MPARGYEGIRRRDDRNSKPWEARFMKTFADGTKKQVSVYAETRDEAKELRDKERLTRRPSAKTSKTTLANFLSDWLARIDPAGVANPTLRVRPRTFVQRTYAVERQIIPTIVNGRQFGSLRLSEVNRANIIAWNDALERDDPKHSRSRQIAFETLRVALNFALDRDLVEANATAKVSKPSHQSKPRVFLSEDQVFKLLDGAEGTQAFPVVHLMLGVGLRIGEALGLLRSDYDAVAGTVSVTATLNNGERGETKTDSGYRTLLLDSETKKALDQHLATLGKSEWLFPRPSGGPYQESNWRNRQFEPVMSAAGLRSLGATPHDLRRAFSTIAQEIGIPQFVAEQILGHKSKSLIGSVYTGLTQKMRQDAADRLGHFFASRHKTDDDTRVSNRVELEGVAEKSSQAGVA